MGASRPRSSRIGCGWGRYKPAAGRKQELTCGSSAGFWENSESLVPAAVAAAQGKLCPRAALKAGWQADGADVPVFTVILRVYSGRLTGTVRQRLGACHSVS